MGKKVVGKFNNKLTKIEFYEVVASYRLGRYTLLRKKGTEKQYLWDSRNSWFSEELGFSEVPTFWEIGEILDNINHWYAGHIFFWSTSKFVTEYGTPEYEMLMDIYNQMLCIRMNEMNIYETMQTIKNESGLLTYIKCLLISKKFLRRQKRTIRDLEREFKVIW